MNSDIVADGKECLRKLRVEQELLDGRLVELNAALAALHLPPYPTPERMSLMTAEQRSEVVDQFSTHASATAERKGVIGRLRAVRGDIRYWCARIAQEDS